jgi:hypothetical protein
VIQALEDLLEGPLKNTSVFHRFFWKNVVGGFYYWFLERKQAISLLKSGLKLLTIPYTSFVQEIATGKTYSTLEVQN